MSLRALFFPAAERLQRDKWGVTFQNAKGLNPETGQLEFDNVDSGVQKAIDEVYAILMTTKIELSEPLVFERADGYTGPMMTFIDDSEGPTITIEGDNRQTDINIGGIDSSVNITNDNTYNDGDLFEITNYLGDIIYGDDNSGIVINNGDTVIVNNPGGGGGGGQQQEDPHIPGKITGGSGKDYTVDLYSGGPFQAATETVEAECIGAEISWAFPHDDIDVWVTVRKTGDDYWFLPPSIPNYRVGLETMGQNAMLTSTFDRDTFIAKPYELQVLPFDGKTIDINGTDIGYNYNGLIVEREASVGLVTETQRIIPEYIVGDTLYIAWAINGTGVVDDDGNEIRWFDLNTAARAWAGVCT